MRNLISSLLIGFGLAVLFSSTGEAGNAASCAQGDVQSAINSAVDGDTVVIPACPGGATWGSTVTVTKGITLQGAGVGQTVILDGVGKGDANCGNAHEVLAFNVPSPKKWRLTGLTVRGSAADTFVCQPGHITVGSTSKAWRIDHIRIENQQTAGIRTGGDTWGVIDHSEFQGSHKDGVLISHPNWGGVDYGDGSWAAPTNLGTEQAIFIEDCTFTDNAPIGAGAIDVFDGGRVVFRFNKTSGFIATHGTESSGRRRGVRSYEIYNNIFPATPDNTFAAIFLRGGTGVIYNNTFTGGFNIAAASNFRDTDSFGAWGMCNGSGPYDGPGGYPCVDQVGRGAGRLLSGDPPSPTGWVNQASEPVYQWGNTLNGQPNPGIGLGAGAVNIQPGRDFIDNQSKPGYVAFPYPHPLVSGSAAPSTPASTPAPAPPAPSNLTVK